MIAALGTIAALMGVFVAIRAIRFARRVAEAQRVFESADLQFYVEGEKDITHIEIALPFRAKRMVDFPLMWSISNLGDKSASGVLMSLRCNSELRFRGIGVVDVKGFFPGARVSQFHEKNFSTMLSEFPSIHPKVRFVATDRISLVGATIIKSSVTVDTLDKVRVSIPFEAELEYVIDCVLQYRDARPSSRRVSLRVHDTGGSPIQEYFRDYNAAAARLAADLALRVERANTLADRWRNFWKRFRSRGDIRSFVLLYIDAPADQHPKFSGLPVDQVLPEAVRKVYGFRFGAEVLIPAIDVVPIALKRRFRGLSATHRRGG
jgi:hypothetical protein